MATEKYYGELWACGDPCRCMYSKIYKVTTIEEKYLDGTPVTRSYVKDVWWSGEWLNNATLDEMREAVVALLEAAKEYPGIELDLPDWLEDEQE